MICSLSGNTTDTSTPLPRSRTEGPAQRSGRQDRVPFFLFHLHRQCQLAIERCNSTTVSRLMGMTMQRSATRSLHAETCHHRIQNTAHNHGIMGRSSKNIKRLVTDLYDISVQLPGWSASTTETVPVPASGHFHYQIFQTPRDTGSFPFSMPPEGSEQRENETMEAMPDENAASVLTIDAEHYPLAAFRITGNRQHDPCRCRTSSEWTRAIDGNCRFGQSHRHP